MGVAAYAVPSGVLGGIVVIGLVFFWWCKSDPVCYTKEREAPMRYCRVPKDME